MGALFYDDEFHAIRAAIEGGRGYKETAMHLWPSMKPESAYARLKVCTNPQGDQHLRFAEVLELMRFNQSFDPLYFACDETSHHRPSQKAPGDEQAELMRRFIASTQEQKRIAERLERLQGLKAVA